MPQSEPPQPAATPRRFRWRRLVQYRLRTLLIVVTLCAALFAWIGWLSYNRSVTQDHVADNGVTTGERSQFVPRGENPIALPPNADAALRKMLSASPTRRLYGADPYPSAWFKVDGKVYAWEASGLALQTGRYRLIWDNPTTQGMMNVKMQKMKALSSPEVIEEIFQVLEKANQE